MREAPRGVWRRFVLVAAWVVLVIGVTASALGGASWDSYQHTESQKAFASTAATTADSVGAALQRDLDFVATVRSMIVAFPGLTNRSLAPWIHSLKVSSRYRGTMGFGYFVPVDAADLASFAATMAADPVVGAPSPAFAVFPPGSRSQYCLSRLGYILPGNLVPTGLDLCAPAAGANAAASYQRAATTGRSAIAGLGTEAQAYDLSPAAAAAFSDLFAITVPVYRGGVTPSTAPARRLAFTGMLLGTFSTKRLLAPIVARNPTLHVELWSAGVVVARGGAGEAGTGFSYRTSVLSSPNTQVEITGSVSTAGTLQGVGLGAIGAALSLVLFFFLLHVTRSRERAFALVAERTGELRHQALHDPLTGLPNRALLFDRAEQMLRRAHRSARAVGALYVDLDNFKDVNDTFGHQFGDRLLCSVADRLRAALRESDTVGRLGGDEFLVLVDGEGFDVGPEPVAERILSVMTEPFVFDGPPPVTLSVRASIGVAVGSRDNAEDLMRDADVALYEAKAAGKDRFVVFRPEMQTAIGDRLGLEMDLRLAVGVEGQFFVQYQPIMDLTTMTPKGAEALVRWRHPTRGVLQPDAFVPLAEESGMIIPIGRFVLRTACAEAAGWAVEGHRLGVSVNVSPKQLESPAFVDEVRVALLDTGLAPELLSLEITETTLMLDTELTGRTLRELKALGARTSIDDFGTGYSSLAYLRQFPIDTLKIDRTFIARVRQPGEPNALIHSLIQLGQALGIETLAEGIEDEAQLDHLRRERCDSGQGFLFARPLDPADLDAFFSASRGRPVGPDGHRPASTPLAVTHSGVGSNLA